MKKYTYEYCKEITSQYKYKKDLKSKYYGVYDAVMRNKWNKDLFSHMERYPKERIYSYEKSKEIVSKYKYLKDLRENEPHTYESICRNKWFELLNSLKRSYNLQKRMIYVYEFKKYNTAYVGLTYNIKERNNTHHKKGCVYKFTTENNIKEYYPIILKDNIDSENAPKYEEFYMNEYKKNGWILLNKAKAGSLGGKILKEEIIIVFDYEGNIVSKGKIKDVKETLNLPLNLIRLCLRHVNKTCLNYRIFSEDEWVKMGSPETISSIRKIHEEIVVLGPNMEKLLVLENKKEAKKYFNISSSNNTIISLHHMQIKKVKRQNNICYLEDYNKFINGEYKKVENKTYNRFTHEYLIPTNLSEEEENKLIKKLEHPSQWELNRLKVNPI